ncbi:hypothetical protein [Edaphovirga cremea]|jgi:hypothetical protein|uniref:hypothetical protein n=1 Tax=Edaphovirga cremea TaxID=2267246 RepID=UPI000DF014DB|nr:hypothetical protein [Edaphovirga cremea]
MKASLVTLLILQVNSLIDTGKYNHITIDEVHDAIDKERLLRFLKERCGSDLDLSIHFHESMKFEREYEKRINMIYGGYAGQERRKWGVSNSGLCLVLAWTNELIQSHFSFPDSPEWHLDN